MLAAEDRSIWTYATLTPLPPLQLTLGGHFDHLRTIVNRTEFDPKLGVSWNVLANTTLRAAWFTSLKRPLIGEASLRSGQTIEPTQIAGFNQFFDDLTGTKARTWGLAIDQKLTNPFFAADTLLIGAEWSQRQLQVPFVMPAGPPGSTVTNGWKERYGRGYFSWLLGEDLAFNTAIDYEILDRTALGSTIDGFIDIRLLRVPIELRYFNPNGLLGLLRTTVVHEQGQFPLLTSVTSTGVTAGTSTFATVDLGLGWRYPGRPLIATFEVQNLLDSRFHFQDPDPINPRIFARRTFLARLTFRI
jgi:outer membrane receptor protein involved in Fe transport